jgi:curved DNA-binding protein
LSFEPHPTFRAEGRDIHATVPITPWEAALGAQITVPTLGGDVDVTVKPGTQGGRRLRLKGRGLPGPTPGDQIVTLQIMTPPADTDDAKAFYEEMARRFSFNPRN